MIFRASSNTQIFCSTIRDLEFISYTEWSNKKYIFSFFGIGKQEYSNTPSLLLMVNISDIFQPMPSTS